LAAIRSSHAANGAPCHSKLAIPSSAFRKTSAVKSSASVRSFTRRAT
jgi:hypothetical protein